MATTAKIGARIGIEGWQEYRNNIKLIIAQTKELDSESKKLTTTFDKQTASIKDVNKYRDVLNQKLQLSEEALVEQVSLMNQLKTAYENGEVSTNTFNQRQTELQTNINNVKNEIHDFNEELNNLPSSLETIGNRMKTVGEDIVGIGNTLTNNVSKPITNFFKLGINSAVDWQTAFIGVQKTNKEMVDSVGNVTYSYEDLERELKNIGLVTGSSLTDIASVAEISGQLGVATNEVAGFTQAMIEMGDSTNLSGEEAASSIATILNITGKGMPITTEAARQLGNSIVRLGNNYNTTEADIARMSARLAAGATLAGLTAADTLGLATAMSSVGINAEAGGTAMATTLSKIQKEMANFTSGAESNLPRIAEIAGMSADDFANAWQTRPNEAIVAFIKGLGQLDMSSGETVIALDELEMSGIRQANMLESLALASEILEKAMSDSNKAFNEGNDLADEAAMRYESVASQIQQLKNDFELLMIDVGDLLLPTLRDLIDIGKDIIDWARNLSPQTKRLITDCLKVAVVIGPVVTAFGKLTIGAGNLVGAIGKLTGSTGIGLLKTGLEGAATATTGVSTGFLGLLGPIGLTIGAATLFGGTIAKLAIDNEEHLKKIGNDWATTTGDLTKDWDTLATVSGTMFNEMGDVIDISTTDTTNQLLKTWDETYNNLERYTTETRRNVTVEFDGMGGQLSRTMQNTKTNLIQTTGQLKTDVYNDFLSIENDMIEHMKSAKRGIDTNAPALTKSVYQPVKTGIDEINWLGGKMYGYGSDMMDNLRRGIASGIQGVVNKVSELASRIRQYIHFSEPDIGPLSDFNSYMPDMMKQMAKGINDNAYLVENAMNNVAGRMALDGGNSYSYGGVVINLNVPEGANGAMLVDEIETELANRTIRRRAVFN